MAFRLLVERVAEREIYMCFNGKTSSPLSQSPGGTRMALHTSIYYWATSANATAGRWFLCIASTYRTWHLSFTVMCARHPTIIHHLGVSGELTAHHVCRSDSLPVQSEKHKIQDQQVSNQCLRNQIEETCLPTYSTSFDAFNPSPHIMHHQTYLNA
jgi:hypothetical protein